MNSIYPVLSILFLIFALLFLAFVILHNEGWKFGVYPNIRYVGVRDAKLGAVLSASCEIVPRSGRIALNAGLVLWLLSLKFEYMRPDRSQPELPLKK